METRVNTVSTQEVVQQYQSSSTSIGVQYSLLLVFGVGAV